MPPIMVEKIITTVSIEGINIGNPLLVKKKS